MSRLTSGGYPWEGLGHDFRVRGSPEYHSDVRLFDGGYETEGGVVESPPIADRMILCPVIPDPVVPGVRAEPKELVDPTVAAEAVGPSVGVQIPLERGKRIETGGGKSSLSFSDLHPKSGGEIIIAIGIDDGAVGNLSRLDQMLYRLIVDFEVVVERLCGRPGAGIDHDDRGGVVVPDVRYDLHGCYVHTVRQRRYGDGDRSSRSVGQLDERRPVVYVVKVPGSIAGDIPCQRLGDRQLDARSATRLVEHGTVGVQRHSLCVPDQSVRILGRREGKSTGHHDYGD